VDPSGRAIGQSRVTALDPARSTEWTATADVSGFYRFTNLPPSTYTVAATAAGFSSASIANVNVEVDASAVVDLHLAIATRKESVVVPGETPLLQTETSGLGTVLDQTLIQKLPLNERDFLHLALLAPGVLPPVENSELSTRGNFAMSANGGREEFNNFLLDGVDNNDQDTNRYVLQPSVDSVQEFKIATNSYSAAYGRSAGGQVNVITRSGTNDFHGFGYDYLRNRIFDARNFFDGSDKPQLIRNQFGAGAGGAIIHDRTFFFANYDGLRGRQGFSRLATVPPAAARNGDLTGFPVTSDPFTGAPFPGNQIPAGRIDPIAQQILSLYPLPTNASLAGNYLAQPIEDDTLNQYNIRVDHIQSAADRFTFRYSYGFKDIFEPYAENSQELPGFGDYLKDRGHNALFNYVRILNPSTINSLLLGFNRVGRQLLQQNYSTDVNKLWGVDYLPTGPVESGYPTISVLGFSQAGDVATLPIDRHDNTYQLSDTVSLVRGNHAIQAGAEFRKLELNGIIQVYTRGSMSFLGALTGTSMGDLLLGLPTFSIQSHQSAPQTLRTFASNFFVQDDWKVRPNLTLNLGLRYEYNTPPTDPTNRMSIFNPATGDLSQVGTNGTLRSGFGPDYNNFGPRVGFAWSPKEGLVIRGGYGIYYDSGMFVTSSAMYFNPPYFTINVFFPSAAGLLTLQNPFPTNSGFAPPAQLSTLASDIRTAYLHSWNFNIQKEYRWLGTLSAAYVASKGTHLIRSRDLNQPPPGPGDVDPRRPYQGYSGIFYTESGADSNFQSLQLSVRRQALRRLSLIATYMFSKSIDDTSAYLATGADPNFPQNSANYHAERALSSFDVPNYATAAAVYSLPWRNVVLRNVDLSGMLIAHSGQPFTPTLAADNSNTGNTGGTAGSDRPNVVHSPSLDQRSPQMWFDTSAFVIAPPYTFGNAGRNILRGPALSTLDLAVSRAFQLSERTSMTFYFQAFNSLNRTNFDLPKAVADDPTTFGKIFSAKPPRQLQFALRFAF
jgi:hypothetical protein